MKENISTRKKTLFLGLLYFIQGFPYGFQDKLIPLLLIVKGHSPSTVGLIRFLLVPWLTKALFAPLIDMTLTITKWVSISLIGLICICLLNTVWPDSTVHNDNGEISSQFIVTLFLLNLFSAFQDIAVDAIAVNIYSNHKDIMNINTGQVVGYKLGAFFGSGILFWIYSLFNWNGLFTILTLIYSLVLFIFIQYSDHLLITNNENNINSNDKTIPIINKANEPEDVVNVIYSKLWYRGNVTKSATFDDVNDLNRQHYHHHRSETTTKTMMTAISLDIILLYVFLYKLGESGAMATYPFFLTSCGLSSHQIAFWNGTLGVFCSILGSMLASQFSILILTKMINFRLLPLFLQLASITIIHFDLINFSTSNLLYYISLSSMLLLHLIGGLVTTMTFTLMMITCQRMPRSFRATGYTIMSTIEVLGKLILSSISGMIVEWMGFVGAQLLFFIFSIFPCFILHGNSNLLIKNIN